ncbi:MAG: hypothetical protein ABH834_02290 [Candidatus Altiarchaeota archaeon]
MKKKDFDLLSPTLSYLETLVKCREGLYEIQYILTNNGRQLDDEQVAQAYNTFHALLSRQELDAWGRVSMIALGLSEAQRKEIRARVYKRFFEARSEVMYLTEGTGKTPASWRGTDEEELRAWLKEHFAE